MIYCEIKPPTSIEMTSLSVVIMANIFFIWGRVRVRRLLGVIQMIEFQFQFSRKKVIAGFYM